MQRGERVGAVHVAACTVFLALFLPTFTVMGTLNALDNIAKDWSVQAAGPFQCGAVRL